MHPTDLELIQYARVLTGKAPGTPISRLASHLSECAQCREELEMIQAWLADMAQGTTEAPDRSPFEEIAIGLLQPRRSPITFQPLVMPSPTARPSALAADGPVPPAAGLQHRATLYSENPEVLLRVMRDPLRQRDFLQLTADDQSLTSRVYVHLSEPSMKFLTDEHGIAELPTESLENPASLAWRLQLPDATFTLKPLETTQETEETEIELPDGDKIAIQFVHDVAGISLRLRPLRIHGQEAPSQVRVVVCQASGRWQVADTGTGGECVAANLAADSPIEIRLFVIE